MLKDPRSEALATRFASLWLRLQDLSKIHPDYQFFPHFDYTLAESMQRETVLFFDYILKEDRPVPELLTADYTFVNERLAEHYGIPNVTGDRFRRVTLEGEERRGLLGQGSILMLTSIADRTSPVQRGKWILEVLLGSPPPPPPPNVPALEATSESEEGKMLSVREAMEMHRANPACQSCHRVIDPLGLALENFDVTGKWRIRDNGVLVDSAGELYDGQTLDGPKGLRQALLSYQDAFIQSFTESLIDLCSRAAGRAPRHARHPEDRPDRGGARQPRLVLHQGRRGKRRLPDEKGRRRDRDDAGGIEFRWFPINLRDDEEVGFRCTSRRTSTFRGVRCCAV